MVSKVVFMGSPDFAVPALQALIHAPDFEVLGVVTQPDRPAGRGGRVKMQPVKEVALAYDLPVYQPEKLRGAAETPLLEWKAEVFVVAAYGQILKQSVLEMPRFGCINIHGSLLPRWRGAAPIQAAIRAGDAESGLTIMQMDAGLDTGAMLLKSVIPLEARETGRTLHDKLAAMSGELLLKALRGFFGGEISPEAQDEALATYAPRIEKAEGQIHWAHTAIEIDRHVRAFDPAPSTYTFWAGKLLKIVAGEVLPKSDLGHGEVGRGDKDYPLRIGTGAGDFAPTFLQLEGKKRLSAADFLNGNPEILGAVLG